MGMSHTYETKTMINV